MTRAADTRADACVDLLLGFPGGLTITDVMAKLGISHWTARTAMKKLRNARRAAPVHADRGKVLWVVYRRAPGLAARLREASRARTAAAKHARRQAGLKKGPGVKLYENPNFRAEDVPDMPEIRRVVTSWAPVRRAPGPVSVFALGAAS